MLSPNALVVEADSRCCPDCDFTCSLGPAHHHVRCHGDPRFRHLDAGPGGRTCPVPTSSEALADAAWAVLRKYEPELRDGCWEMGQLRDALKATGRDFDAV